MLKKLRMHLTLICSCTTGLILLIICLMVLQLLETQVASRNHIAFETQLQTISYQLQTNQSIKSSWLARLEADNNLIISIEDNGEPFFFKGAWTPVTQRAELIAKAHEIALTTYQFDISEPPASSLTIHTTFFSLQGVEGEPYRVGIAKIPSSRGTYSLTLLQDMRPEKMDMIHTRILFIGISCLGMILLGIFSFWFSGKAILPIEANQKKQVQFIAAASHELKSPLAVIQSSNALIQSQNIDTTMPFALQVEKECKRMARLVDDLLLLATADAHTWSIHKEPIDLDILLIDMLDTFIPLAKEKKQHLTLHLPDTEFPPLLCDAERISQAIMILIDNALHYVQEGGHIQVTAHVTPDAYLIEVIDDGPGITPEHTPHIFDRFYRVDTSRKDKNHYGLGLSIAWEIIRLHSGSLVFKDTPGGGCTFSITLPLHS